LIRKEDQQSGARTGEAEDRPARPAVGIDVGATLAKLAVLEPGGRLDFGFLPASALGAVAKRIRALGAASIGLTGCGAARLEAQLDETPARFIEFEAWGTGSRVLLERQDVDTDEPYLLVSVGTGTSVLQVEQGSATRLGGSALGGGTVLGLGVALTGCESYEELCGLAERGQRSNVDLMVSDIYPPGEIALPGDLTAASFGNLARWLSPENEGGAPASGDPSQREDLAASVMGLVGENVALICCGLAERAGVGRVVYGGATLKQNPALVAVLLGITAGMGRQPVLLSDGGFAGAVGALEMAAAPEQ
jgi:type II pantothenate kinase